MFEKECIYIAGPECFYPNGYKHWDVMRKRAEAIGFSVSLPNDNPLKLDNEDLRKNADTIFYNCAESMNKSTCIIADLEAFRGSEADGGTIYEIGMAYGRGIRCYGYTRDKRNVLWKNQRATLKGGIVYDEAGRIHPYSDLPFSPNIIGSTKIIEGDFDDCLKMLITDIEEEYKRKARKSLCSENINRASAKKGDKKVVYLSNALRYDADGKEKYEVMKAICADYGLEAISPLDAAEGVEKITTENPYERAANEFDNYTQQVRNCDVIIADLNDFRGYEPSNDVSFECGMAFQLGKKLYGYMNDTRIMKKRVPNYGETHRNVDMCGCDVENFDYPINLMFSSSMKIFQGEFEEVIKEIAKDINSGR